MINSRLIVGFAAGITTFFCLVILTAHFFPAKKNRKDVGIGPLGSSDNRCTDGTYSVNVPAGFECNRIPGEADLCVEEIQRPNRFVEVYGAKPLPVLSERESARQFAEKKMTEIDRRADAASGKRARHLYRWQKLGPNLLFLDEPITRTEESETMGILIASNCYCLARIVQPKSTAKTIDQQLREVVASIRLQAKVR